MQFRVPVVVGGSQRILTLNPTTVLVALFLGLWLLFGCDHYGKVSVSFSLNFETHPSLCLEVMKVLVSVSKKPGKKSHQSLDLEIPKFRVSVSVSYLRLRKSKSRYWSRESKPSLADQCSAISNPPG